ncbi:hypothetical protein BpHYR1_022500 [Brachionus plicatilis]|uniref:Uncharacterized protein n=1 Tax=Brachionus plicatilis TaxID=10195 RepID=A0A3M7R3G3_BRAPC|nr:hypothetical protein BpHYR1_022500 [Brachionus plicatilis]
MSKPCEWSSAYLGADKHHHPFHSVPLSKHLLENYFSCKQRMDSSKAAEGGKISEINSHLFNLCVRSEQNGTGKEDEIPLSTRIEKEHIILLFSQTHQRSNKTTHGVKQNIFIKDAFFC